MYSLGADIDDEQERRRLIAWAASSESEARLRAAVKLAETEREIIVHPDELDADPWLFNTANGTIDLRSGDLRDHRRQDLLTKITRSSTTLMPAPTCGTGSSTGSRLATPT